MTFVCDAYQQPGDLIPEYQEQKGLLLIEDLALRKIVSVE